MMFFPPFSPFYYRNYRNYRNLNNYNYLNRPNVNFEKENSFFSSKQENTKKEENYKKEDRNNNELSDEYFEVFGLKLYFDDILLICMIFFLYQEGVKDQMLFISLILLLLS